MKTNQFMLIAALAATVLTGTACGNKQQKNIAEAATTEQPASAALEIDSLLADAENPVGKVVSVEGVSFFLLYGGKRV